MNRQRVFLVMVAVVFLGAVWLLVGRDQPTESPNINQPEPQLELSAEGRYLFSGTIVLGRAVERLAVDQNGNRDYAQPFSRLDSFEPDNYDAWGSVFECPITDNVVPYQSQIDNLVFNCRPEFLPDLTRYITLFNLANNHTADMEGDVGLTSTRQYLEQAGVQHYGHFNPSVTEDICEVIGLPVRLKTDQDESVRRAELPIAFCSWHFFNYNRGPTDEELAVARRYAEVMPVFAFVEMGVEYQAEASPEQVEIARSIIDAGAEFVFANNPHWVQNSEVYNGKLIVYSLGNFIFDQIEPETLRGVSIDTTMRIAGSTQLNSWLQLAEDCSPKTFKDQCLTLAKERNLTKLQLSLSYDAVANTSGFRVVTEKANSQIQSEVRQRLRWDDSIAALKRAEQ